MKLTELTVDASLIEILPVPEAFVEYCHKQGWTTIGQLRSGFRGLELNPPNGVGYGKAIRRLLTVRFTQSPVCAKCSSLMLLHDNSRSCPAGCGGMIPMPPRTEVRRAFPDLAVNRKKTEKALPKKEALPGQMSMFDKEDYRITSNEYSD